MSQSSKQRKLNNVQFATIFNNDKDKQQCLNILTKLYNATEDLNIKTTNSICKEIAEYATGLMVPCPGNHYSLIDDEYKKNNLSSCPGFIHYLHGDNFQHTLFCSYECDLPSDECNKTFHIFNNCTLDGCGPVNKLVQTHIDIYPNHACNSLCGVIHCDKHWRNNGSCCEYCSKYFCSDCTSKNGFRCCSQYCSKYICSDCCYIENIDDEDDDLDDTINDTDFYCATCKFDKK